MKAVGIIAEFNPFHKGHKYLLNAVRNEYPSCGIVCIVSGNFTQRGYPAICDKWSRARMAIAEGADLVCELPAAYALSAAPDFAFGGVRLLKEIGADTIAFGTETADIKSLKHLFFCEPAFKENIARGMSYSKALGSAFPVPLLPNDILACEYMKACKALGYYPDFFPVKRTGAGHHESASYIRENPDKASEFMPEKALEIFGGCRHFGADADKRLFDVLRYEIIRRSPEELAQIYGVSEGIENSLKKNINYVSCFDEYVKAVKSKRYTYTRISRIMMHCISGLTAGLFNEIRVEKPYMRVLALNRTGAEILKNAGSRGTVISNLKKKAVVGAEFRSSIEFDVKTSEIYNLLMDENLSLKNDFVINPVLLN